MLHYLAGLLDVLIIFFFDDLPEGMKHPPPPPENHMMRRESLDLMKYYCRVSDEPRRQVYELVRAMGRKEWAKDECVEMHPALNHVSRP